MTSAHAWRANPESISPAPVIGNTSNFAADDVFG
jgi:hypothetical protein